MPMSFSPLTDNERALFLNYEAGPGRPQRVASISESNNGRHVPLGVAKPLYISHFLSTWNSRVFEFGSVLYLAAIFPGTLLPMSVYALARGLSAICLSSFVGQYVDRGNRLQVVRLSIVLQRLVVSSSCLIFYALARGLLSSVHAKTGVLALAALLACVEKLCAIMNLVAVERDWVVVIAEKDQGALRRLNAQMRQIDLTCKLAGPLFIAFVDSFSTQRAILVNLTMNMASIIAEYSCIAKVYKEVPQLQQPKTAAQGLSDVSQSRLSNVRLALRHSVYDFALYFRHPVFLPSFAGTLLYFTVLSFSGQMVTYLLSAGYTSGQIGSARALSVGFEVLATWIAPWLMNVIGNIRAGLWLSSAQIMSLLVGVGLFLIFSASQPVTAASGLVGGTILSRVGLRGFDLCAQIIVQEEVEAGHRGAFSSVEAAWQNLFELFSYTVTIIFSQPDEFSWPVVTSISAVASAWALYTWFVYSRRGHLLHLPACVGEKRRHSGEQLIENIHDERARFL
ncbi:Ferroporti-1 [Triangularia setosa]|uniref:Solute carrier family 40 member n=1 Tax=Triangularia setosa TaxID=2587417 RepID=A0AAN7A4R2_9PEZI|nr:Ferroporti-1 [Podospora setosa]